MGIFLHIYIVYFVLHDGLITRVMRRQLSTEERQAIITAVREDGQTIASVAQEYHRNRKTISKILATNNRERRTKLSRGAKQLIDHLVEENPSTTLCTIRTALSSRGYSTVSRYTIARYMKKMGYEPIRRKPRCK